MISVCIATHNGGSFLKEQLTSILCQIGENDEVIISDDGSTDDTLKIINGFNDKRIIVVNQKSHKGLPAHEYATLNFENALKASHGDFIFLSDQDDVWVNNKIEVMMGYLKTYPYVVSDCYVTDKDLNVISETRFLKSERMHFNKYAALILSTPYQGSCAAFRREVLDKALPFPKGLQSHDRWIGDVAAFFFSVRIIHDKLIYYRRHEGTTSNTFNKKKVNSLMKTIHYKWIYIKGIINLMLE